MHSKSKPSEPSHHRTSREPPPPPVKPKPTLKDLSRILFDELSEQFETSEDIETEVPWRRISIHHCSEMSQLLEWYQVRIRQLFVNGTNLSVWISFSEGYVTNSFCLYVSTPNVKQDDPNLSSELLPILIIESGHPVPVPIQDKGAEFMIEETALSKKIKQKLFSKTYTRIVELQRDILLRFANLLDQLPRQKRQNPMYDPS